MLKEVGRLAWNPPAWLIPSAWDPLGLLWVHLELHGEVGQPYQAVGVDPWPSWLLAADHELVGHPWHLVEELNA